MKIYLAFLSMTSFIGALLGLLFAKPEILFQFVSAFSVMGFVFAAGAILIRNK